MHGTKHTKASAPVAETAAESRPGRASERSPAQLPAWAGAQGALPARSLFVQAKLAVNQPGDVYEQEADRAAEQVMCMSDPAAAAASPPPALPGAPPSVQRACACGGTSASGDEECEVCQAQSAMLQRATAAPVTPTVAPPLVHQVLGAPGRPLDVATRAFMEPRFGADFDDVRVHTDALAAESARAVSARAYTVGSSVVFGAGQYQPGTSAGRQLLAHELAHTIQQGAAPSSPLVQRSARPADLLQRDDTPAAQQAAETARPLGLQWRGSVRESIFQYLRYVVSPVGTQTTDQAAAALTNQMLSNRNVSFTVESGGKIKEATLAEFEEYCRKRNQVTLGSSAVQFLMEQTSKSYQALKLLIPAPEVFAGLEAALNTSDFSTKAPTSAAEQRRESGREGEPVVKVNMNLGVMATNPPLAALYLRLMEHFGGLKKTPEIVEQAKDGLTEAELNTIIGTNQRLSVMTAIFTQGWQEFQQAGGTELEDHFALLQMTIFEQFVWGNSNARRNQLKIAKGWPEGHLGVGIAFRPDGMLLYDNKGQPLPSFAGGVARDPEYASTKPPEFGFNIASINDPVLRGFLNLLRKQVGEPTRMVGQAAQIYFENIDLVNAKVREGLSDAVIKKFEEALPMFVAFLAGHGLSTLLMRAPNPALVSIGLALKGLLTVAGYIMDIDFLGSAMQRLLAAAEHLVRVTRDEDGKLDELSRHQLELAAVPIRAMVTEIALVATTIGLGKLLGAVRKRGSASIECTHCDIKLTDTAMAEVQSLAKDFNMPRDEAVALREALLRESSPTRSRGRAEGRIIVGENAIARHFEVNRNDYNLPEFMVRRNDNRFLITEVKNQNEPDIGNVLAKFRDIAGLIAKKYGEYQVGRFDLYIKEGFKAFSDKMYSIGKDGLLHYEGKPVMVDGLPVNVIVRELGTPGG